MKFISEVEKAYTAHWGFPDGEISFGNPEYLGGHPLRVLYWHARDAEEVTLMATLGMYIKEMANAEHRAELHFPIGRKLDQQQITDVANFIADLAAYPFENKTHFDWWHKIKDVGKIPIFDGFSSLFFHPKFMDFSLDTINMDRYSVKLLNIVPLAKDEVDIDPIEKLLDYLHDHEIDIFNPR
jgi:hypothetical protein